MVGSMAIWLERWVTPCTVIRRSRLMSKLMEIYGRTPYNADKTVDITYTSISISNILPRSCLLYILETSFYVPVLVR